MLLLDKHLRGGLLGVHEDANSLLKQPCLPYAHAFAQVLVSLQRVR